MHGPHHNRKLRKGAIDLLTALIVIGIVGMAAFVVLLLQPAAIAVTPASTFATDAVQWRTDFEAARSESQRTGRPLLIDFTASWCPPCTLMKEQT